jgi:polysaccharide biosynthesis/export protein
MPMIRNKLILGVWLAVACAACAAGQTQPPPPPSPVIITPPPTAAPASTQAPPEKTAQPQTPEGNADKAANQDTAPDKAMRPDKASAATGSALIIGAEDVLFIRVWQQPELSGSVSVGPDGTISLQLIDEVKAAGLTPRQLEQELVVRFKKFIREPEVNVQLIRMNSRTFIIQGDGVNRPGIYPLTRPMTVMEALLAGGGFTTFANKKKMYVLRGTTRFNFNWIEVSKGKNLKQNIVVQNGDQIYVN